MSKPCSKCKGEMSGLVLDPFRGEQDGLKLSVHGMPCLVCGQGHKRFIHIEFAAQLMDLVMSPESYRGIPIARKKGLFKKHYHCPACDKELPESTTGQKAQEIVAELPKAEPFKVMVEVPVLKCGGCGTESIRSIDETAKLAFKAIDQAYRSIDIHPT